MIAIRVESSYFHTSQTPYAVETCSLTCTTVLNMTYSLFHITFLQRVRIAYNAVRCNSYGNSVRPTVRLSVRLSHAGIVPRLIKIGSCGLHCESKYIYSFLIPTLVGGDIPFYLKFAPNGPPPLKSADFDQYLLITSQP